MSMIEVKNLSHIYNAGTALESKAFEEVSFPVDRGEYIGLIGHTGSGKSTLIQHLNGLLTPTSGTVLFDGQDIFAKGYDLKSLRARVGMVFQYPEYQLFEETVLKDVMFGPVNLGKTEQEARRMAVEALRLVRFPEEFYQKSPFELSGGQKRMAAVAGVLAMEPEVLILDEPAAGLDPAGRERMLHMVNSLRKEKGITIILVSHSMDDVARWADRILVMDCGRLAFDDTPTVVFSHVKELEQMGLSAPQLTYLAKELNASGFTIDPDILTLEEARKEILKNFAGPQMRKS